MLRTLDFFKSTAQIKLESSSLDRHQQNIIMQILTFEAGRTTHQLKWSKVRYHVCGADSAGC